MKVPKVPVTLIHSVSIILLSIAVILLSLKIMQG